jgi:hypothetical protein
VAQQLALRFRRRRAFDTHNPRTSTGCIICPENGSADALK